MMTRSRFQQSRIALFFGRKQKMITKTLLLLSYDMEHWENARHFGQSTCIVTVVVLPGKYFSQKFHDQVRSCKSVATTLLWLK